MSSKLTKTQTFTNLNQTFTNRSQTNLLVQQDFSHSISRFEILLTCLASIHCQDIFFWGFRRNLSKRMKKRLKNIGKQKKKQTGGRKHRERYSRHIKANKTKAHTLAYSAFFYNAHLWRCPKEHRGWCKGSPKSFIEFSKEFEGWSNREVWSPMAAKYQVTYHGPNFNGFSQMKYAKLGTSAIHQIPLPLVRRLCHRTNSNTMNPMQLQ